MGAGYDIHRDLDKVGRRSEMTFMKSSTNHIDGLVLDCSNSIANAPELLQSCTKLSISCTYCEYLVQPSNAGEYSTGINQSGT